MAPLVEGLQVVDLTDLRGALAGRLLADMGADVIRIAAPELSSPTDSDAAHTFRNANKRSVAPDLTTPNGLAQVESLLHDADVLIDNLPNVRRSDLGLEPHQVRARWPHLVHTTITDFGLSGPRAHWRAEPLVAAAVSGAHHATGLPELPPCAPPGYLAHDCASAMAVTGTIAAVIRRPTDGHGDHIEISVQEAALAGLVPWSVVVEDYLHINPALPAKGTRNGDGVYLVVPAADGHIRVVLGNPSHFDAFIELCGRPNGLDGDEWRQPMFRNANRDALKLLIGDSLADRTRSQLVEQALEIGTTIGAVQRPSEFADHAQVKARASFQEFDGELIAAAPIVVDGHRVPVHTPASTPGRHAWDAPSPHRKTSAFGSDSHLLDGVRVVEFGVAAVVPELNYMLSEFGADVVKIESSVHPDILRRTGLDKLNCGFAYNTECRGRRSVALDLTTTIGRELAVELCRQADVITENHRGTALDQFGLDEASIRSTNPDVIYVSSQGYGQGGPLGQMPAFGPLNSAFVGVHHLWNHPEAPFPCGTSLNHPDHIAGKLCSAWVMAALARRDRTGQGAHIDMAQTEIAAYLIGDLFVDLHRSGTDPEPLGNRSDLAVPHNVFPSDGDDTWLAVVCADDESFANLCGLIGLPEDSWPSLHDRLANREQIETAIAGWTRTRLAGDAAAELQLAGVSAAPVMGPQDHRSCAHLDERGFLVDLEHPEAGPERHTGNAIRPANLKIRTAGPAPCLGEHTHEVLTELDLTHEEVDQLVRTGVAR